MSLTRVASTYAKSLIELAIEQDQITAVNEDMQALEQAIKSRDLVLMLKSPIIKKGTKAKVLNTLFSDKLGKLTNGFINIVVRKGRENVLPEIIGAFKEEYKRFKKITSITLITAQDMSKESLEAIKTKLVNSNLTLDTVEINTKVDPSIIGGFVVQLGDKLYDASVAHQLSTLKKEFSDNEL
jgi:F-type H+-transporting ATPase subunit delta